MATTVLEGTWEELQQYSSLLRGHRLRVSILDEESRTPTSEEATKHEPNEQMRKVMRKLKPCKRICDRRMVHKLSKFCVKGAMGNVRQMSQNLPAPAVVPDANILIALCSNERLTFPLAEQAFEQYVRDGWEFFAPSIIAAEVLYVLCQKLTQGILTEIGLSLFEKI